jgi:molecular chaperone DnaK
MIKDAEKHASDDAKRKETVEAANMADSAVYSGEKFIEENAEKISDAQRSSIQAEIDNVKAAMSGAPEALKSAVDRLQQVMQEVGTSMYQQESPESGATDGQTEDSPAEEDEDVVEGEFSEE